MTHPTTQFTGCREAIQLLSEHGFDGLAGAFELLLNEVMKIERCEALQAAPYQRTEARQGYANGFKDKTVHSRVGDLHLKVPQTRNVEFYPQTLERGVRSERALTAALAEMYVQGVSTRKVSKIVEDCRRTLRSRSFQFDDQQHRIASPNVRKTRFRLRFTPRVCFVKSPNFYVPFDDETDAGLRLEYVLVAQSVTRAKQQRCKALGSGTNVAIIIVGESWTNTPAPLCSLISLT